MALQQGSFQGIDSADITMKGNFAFCSKLLEESESRSIVNRPDINALLDNLVQHHILCPEAAQSFCDHAKSVYPDQSVFDPYLHGCTYMPLNDAMDLQKAIGEDKHIFICEDDCMGNLPQHDICCKINWPHNILLCQKLDKDNFGASFPIIPPLFSSNGDAQLLWVLCGVYSRVKELWRKTTNIPLFWTSLWHGWILLFVGRHCFPELCKNHTKKNPFKVSHID